MTYINNFREVLCKGAAHRASRKEGAWIKDYYNTVGPNGLVVRYLLWARSNHFKTPLQFASDPRFEPGLGPFYVTFVPLL